MQNIIGKAWSWQVDHVRRNLPWTPELPCRERKLAHNELQLANCRVVASRGLIDCPYSRLCHTRRSSRDLDMAVLLFHHSAQSFSGCDHPLDL